MTLNDLLNNLISDLGQLDIRNKMKHQDATMDTIIERLNGDVAEISRRLFGEM